MDRTIGSGWNEMGLWIECSGHQEGAYLMEVLGWTSARCQHAVETRMVRRYQPLDPRIVLRRNSKVMPRLGSAWKFFFHHAAASGLAFASTAMASCE